MISKLKYIIGLLGLLAVTILPVANTDTVVAADIATNTFSDNNTALASVASPFIRDNFIGKGRHWVFYSDGTNIYFKSSTDGSTWSSATYVRAGTAGWNINTYWDGTTYVYYVWGNAVNNVALYWRRGTPASDGTITWDSEQIAVAAGAATNFFGHSVGVDSAGKCYIAYQISPSGEKIYASKNANTDGTLSTVG